MKELLQKTGFTRFFVARQSFEWDTFKNMARRWTSVFIGLELLINDAVYITNR